MNLRQHRRRTLARLGARDLYLMFQGSRAEQWCDMRHFKGELRANTRASLAMERRRDRAKRLLTTAMREELWNAYKGATQDALRSGTARMGIDYGSKDGDVTIWTRHLPSGDVYVQEECPDCDGRGGGEEWPSGDPFQPPERTGCPTCGR